MAVTPAKWDIKKFVCTNAEIADSATFGETENGLWKANANSDFFLKASKAFMICIVVDRRLNTKRLQADQVHRTGHATESLPF